MVDATGQLLLVEKDQLARPHGFIREAFLLLVRSVDPNNGIRLAQSGHLFYPLLKFSMLDHGANMVVAFDLSLGTSDC